MRLKNKENKILLTNIQRFSLHDGPGIRTTVFLKGCSLRCPWCSNPENLVSQPQEYIKDGLKSVYGKYYTPGELIKECLKDKMFFGELLDNYPISTAEQIDTLPGGITFSGGECLLQMNKLIPVCEQLHRNNIHIAVETCLFVPEPNLRLALDHVDLFYVDMKILNSERCKDVEKGNLDLYLKNIHTLLTWTDRKSRHKPVIIRIPVIGRWTDNLENQKAVHDLICKYQSSVLKIELIKEHDFGASKYKSLNMEMSYYGVSDDILEEYKNRLSDLCIPTEICRIR